MLGRLTLILVLVVQLLVAIPILAQVERREVGNLAIEGIPDIPERIIDRMRQYRNTRLAKLDGWEPTGNGIIIRTRFGQTTQIHWIETPLGARQQLTFFDEPIQAANVCPDPTHSGILFRKDIGGNELYQIFYLDRKSGRVLMISDGESRNDDVVWSESGKRFAYTSTRRNGTDWDVFVSEMSDLTAARPVVERTGYWAPLSWSPDGNKLLVENYISINESYFWVVDITSGDMKQVNPSKNKVSYGTGVFNGNGSALYLTSDYQSEYRQLKKYDLVSGEMRTLSTDIPWDVTELEMSPAGDKLAFTVNENGSSRLYLLNTQTNRYSAVPGCPMGIIEFLHFSPDGTQLAFCVDAPNSPEDVYSMDLETYLLVRWTKSEVGGLDTDMLAVPEIIEYPTFDSVGGRPRMIPAIYYTPRGTSGPHPVVVYIHGGPENQARPYFSSRIQYWVNELKLAVLQPNVRGSKGYGKSYLLMDNGFKREESVKDIGRLLDWISEQSELDESRVAVYGGSYGGYMVLSAMTHYNDRLRAAVDIVGISNFVTFLQNTKDYRRNLRRAEYGDERDPEMYDFLNRISPTTNAHKITKPLFIAQGLNDPRVPASEAEQILAEVRKNGSDAWYLLAKDEGHGFRKKDNRDFYEQSTVMFFEEYLLK